MTMTRQPTQFVIPFVGAALLLAGALIPIDLASQAPVAGGAAPPQAGAPAAGGGGARGGGAPVAYEDYAGFTKIWDGQTFNGWEGETDVWSIDNGAIHADTTKTPGQHHLHYKGSGAVMRDFNLKVEMKMSAAGANGGIQYRSRLLHALRAGSIANPLGSAMPAGVTTIAQAVERGLIVAPAPRGGGAGGNRGAGNGQAAPGGGPVAPAAATPNPCVGQVGNLNPAPAGAGRGNAAPAALGALPTGNPWQISGYQFDMNSANNYTGQLYEGQGRGIVNAPGGMVLLLPGNCSARIATITANPAAAVKPHLGRDGEWNQIEIIARGHTLTHMINGQVITVTIDDNPVARAPQGIMSLQLEGSGQIWYRNVYVRHLGEPSAR